jgi:hypothetical protein
VSDDRSVSSRSATLWLVVMTRRRPRSRLICSDEVMNGGIDLLRFDEDAQHQTTLQRTHMLQARPKMGSSCGEPCSIVEVTDEHELPFHDLEGVDTNPKP